MKPITLTVVIPAYNEGQRLFRSFGALDVFEAPEGIEIKEIRFVNDGSTDNTLSVLKRWQRQWHNRKHQSFRVRVLSYKHNRGRGYAVRYGMANITTDYVVYLDGDMSIPLDNLQNFLPFMKKRIDVLAGSKKKPGAAALPDRVLLRKIVGYGHTALASLVLGVFYWDFQGGFKLFSKRYVDEVLHKLTMERWGLDMEVLFLAKRLKFSTVELPVAWASIEQGTTVKLGRDIVRSLQDMVQMRIKHEVALATEFMSFARLGLQLVAARWAEVFVE